MAAPMETGPTPLRSRNGWKAEKSLARTATWMVGLAAAALVLISVGGYFYHRHQLAAIATEHLRLIVTGPAGLQVGSPTEYAVSTTAISGQPLQAQVEVALSAADGTRLTAFRETSDERGRLQVVIPADLSLPSQTTLKVAASYRESREETEIPLAVEPTRDTACLTVDKPLYQPGDTIYYRLLVLSGSSLSAGASLPVQFEIRDARGASLPQSRQAGVTERGIAGGAFVTAKSLAAGEYTLIARSPDQRFPEQRRPFSVRGYHLPRADKPSDRSKPIPILRGPVSVAFFPEGGELAAGLETRVYFVARDSLGQPVSLSGKIIASSVEKDREQPTDHTEKADRENEIATFETTFRGMGVFAFIPRADWRYRVEVTTPAHVKCDAELPPVSTERNVVLSTGGGVFAGGTPMEFNIRAAKPALPLVVAAYCRGVQVGEQPLVTKDGPTGANSVAVALDDAVSGVVRLVVFDYSHSPPQPVAERLVYRRASQKLNVQVADQRPLHRPGEPVELSLTITNEKGEPTPAVLGVSVVDEALLNLADNPAPSMPAHFLLTSELRRPEDLEDADFYLSDESKDGVPAAVALDLLLGTQGGGGLAEKGSRPPAGKAPDHERDSTAAPADTVAPPVMSDNVLKIRDNYDQSLSDYRAEHTRTLNAPHHGHVSGWAGAIIVGGDARADADCVGDAPLDSRRRGDHVLPDHWRHSQRPRPGTAQFRPGRAVSVVSRGHDSAAASQVGPHQPFGRQTIGNRRAGRGRGGACRPSDAPAVLRP